MNINKTKVMFNNYVGKTAIIVNGETIEDVKQQMSMDGNNLREVERRTKLG